MTAIEELTERHMASRGALIVINRNISDLTAMVKRDPLLFLETPGASDLHLTDNDKEA